MALKQKTTNPSTEVRALVAFKRFRDAYHEVNDAVLALAVERGIQLQDGQQYLRIKTNGEMFCAIFPKKKQRAAWWALVERMLDASTSEVGNA